MKIEKALVEIEGILNQVEDPITLYQSFVGRELQDILRRVRNEKKDEVVSDIKRL